MRDQIKQQMILAMKNKDSATLSTIRLIMSKIKDKEISDRALNKEITEGDILQVLQQMVKQRNDSIAEYEKVGRVELVAKEQEEIAVIKQFLPAQLSLEEVVKVVDEAIKKVNPEGARDMGKVIALIREEYAGKVDISLASKLIKDKLQ